MAGAGPAMTGGAAMTAALAHDVAGTAMTGGFGYVFRRWIVPRSRHCLIVLVPALLPTFYVTLFGYVGLATWSRSAWCC